MMQKEAAREVMAHARLSQDVPEDYATERTQWHQKSLQQKPQIFNF